MDLEPVARGRDGVSTPSVADHVRLVLLCQTMIDAGVTGVT